MIKNSLSTQLELQIRQNKAISFTDYLNQHLKQIEDASYSSDEWKENDKNVVKKLLSHKVLNEQLETLRNATPDPKSKMFQESIENQLISNLTKIADEIQSKNDHYKLNLLFMEYDYQPESIFYGYDDESYEFKLLSGEEYLKFEYEKSLFQGAGFFDYSKIMAPVWNLDEKLNLDDDYEVIEGFVQNLKELNLANVYFGIHLCLEKINQDIFNVEIPMKDEVYVFGNEHDCEQRNIYALERG